MKEKFRSKFESLLDFHADNLTQDKLQKMKELFEARETREIASLYLHLSNGGASFKILDNYGPTLQISTSNFGNNTHKHTLTLTKESFTRLKELFEYAEKQDFSEEYVHPLKAYESIEFPNQERQEKIDHAYLKICYAKEDVRDILSGKTFSDRYDDEGNKKLIEELDISSEAKEEIIKSLSEKDKDRLAYYENNLKQATFDLEFLEPSVEELESAKISFEKRESGEEDGESGSAVKSKSGKKNQIFSKKSSS